MLANGFMLEIRDHNKLQLGRTEKLFLNIIALEPISVYKISRGLKNGFFFYSEGILSTGIKSMAYKNVHKRIKRLYSLGLIEKIQGTFERNAKIYKLTTRGLLEQLIDSVHIVPDIIGLYRNDPIIETLVYQYFEFETIGSFDTDNLILLKRLYLTRCCEVILNTLDVHRYETDFLEKSRLANLERRLKEHDGYLTSYVDSAIRSEVKKFVFEIVDMSKHQDPYQTDKENGYFFPRQALINDKRFVALLKEIKNNFDKGCKNYI